MLKLNKLLFLFFFFIFALLSRNLILADEQLNLDDAYWNVLDNVKLENELENIFKSSQVKNSVQLFINKEILKGHLLSKEKDPFVIATNLENELFKKYPDLFNSELRKGEAHRFITELIEKHGSAAYDFFNNFVKNVYDVNTKYEELNSMYNENVKEIGELRESFFNDSYELNDELQTLLHKNLTEEDEEKIKEFMERGDRLQENVNMINDRITNLHELLNRLNDFENDFEANINDYQVRNDGKNDNELLDLLKKLIRNFINNLRGKVSNILDKLGKELEQLKNELDKLNKRLKEIEDKRDNTKLLTRIDGYERLNYEVRKNNNNEEQNIGYLIETLNMLKENNSTFEKIDFSVDNLYIYDIKKKLNLNLNLLKIINDLYVTESDLSIQIYTKLYKEIYSYLYEKESSAYSEEYKNAWEGLNNYRGHHFKKHYVDLKDQINIMKKFLTHLSQFKEKANLEESYVNITLEELEKIKSKIEMYQMKLEELVYTQRRLIESKTSFESELLPFKSKYVEFRAHVNSFQIATENLYKSSDEILKTLSSIFRDENLIDDMKRIRRLWKDYCSYTKSFFKRKNNVNFVKDGNFYKNGKSNFFELYKQDRNIIFPPELGLSKDNENSDINKNFLSTFYFEEAIYKNTLKKYDAMTNENQMLKAFSTEYRSVDPVIGFLKNSIKKLKKKYKEKRKEILYFIHLRSYNREHGIRTHVKLMEIEHGIVIMLDSLFGNKINIPRSNVSLNNLKYIFFKNEPAYIKEFEDFIQKRFLTFKKLRSFINTNKYKIPPHLIFEHEDV